MFYTTLLIDVGRSLHQFRVCCNNHSIGEDLFLFSSLLFFFFLFLTLKGEKGRKGGGKEERGLFQESGKATTLWRPLNRERSSKGEFNPQKPGNPGSLLEL